MTLAEALAAESRGEGSVRFRDGVPTWTREPPIFVGPTSRPASRFAEVRVERMIERLRLRSQGKVAS